MRGITFARWARSYPQELHVTCDSKTKTHNVESVEGLGHTAAQFMLEPKQGILLSCWGLRARHFGNGCYQRSGPIFGTALYWAGENKACTVGES
jgi:hypothetical protein